MAGRRHVGRGLGRSRRGSARCLCARLSGDIAEEAAEEANGREGIPLSMTIATSLLCLYVGSRSVSVRALEVCEGASRRLYSFNGGFGDGMREDLVLRDMVKRRRQRVYVWFG